MSQMQSQQSPQKSLAELKKQLVCTDSALRDFNWKLNMPLDYSQVQKDNKILLDHQQVKENQVITKDIRAPHIEFTFELSSDAAKEEDPAERKVNVNFKKTQLQAFFEELEKIQLKLDELTN